MSRPARRYQHRLERLIAVGLASSLLSACSTAAGSSTEGPAASSVGAAEGESCRYEVVRGGALEAPGPVSKPRSTLAVDVRIPFARVEREVANKVPKVLKSVKGKPIGAPGEVTLQVTRGKPSAKLDGTSMVVTFPVSASVSVCKPIGPICPEYASCKPSMLASGSVPLLLDEDYGWGGSDIDVRVKRGCSIAGLDFTSRVTSEIGKARGQAKRQIDGAVPAIKPLVENALALASRSMPIGDDQCLIVRPDTLSQARPRTEGEELSLGYAFGGDVTIETCPSRRDEVPPSAALPALDTVATLPDTIVRTLVPVSYQTIQDALATHLASRPVAGGAVDLTEVRGAVRDGKPVLRIDARVEGGVCGELTLTAAMDARDGRLTLRDAQVVGAGSGDATVGQDFVRQVVEHLEQVAIDVDIPFASRLETGRGVLTSILAADELETLGVALSAELSPVRVAGGIPAADQLMVVVALEATLSAALKP